MTDNTTAASTLFKFLTITAIKEEAPAFRTFVFGADDANAISYQSGQYLTFVHQEHGAETRRSYSITSSPALQEPLAIGVKRVENGFFSRKLVDNAQVGDKLLTIGAAGLFTLPDDIGRYKQVFLLAAGSGITPVFSLLKTILYTYPQLHVVLLYSNSSHKSIIFREELEQLAERFPEQLQVKYLLSDSPDLARARLYKDLLQLLLKKYAVAPYNQILFYLCGPLNYMRMCYYALRQVAVPNDNIRKESFSTTKVVASNKPPDIEPHQVTLRFRKQEHQLMVKYPQTILQAAKKKGIILPYSCEAGKCGSCAAHCTHGQVWMSYNEVLTEKDLKKGIALTCVGYPVGGDVVLDVM